MKKRLRETLKLCTGAIVFLFLAPVALAQYSSDFESLTAGPFGTLLTGQDGYYIPVAGSADYFVYQYTGNPYGLPQNPTGGNQFVAGEAGVNVNARAQRDIVWPSGLVNVAYDWAAAYTSVPPAMNNVGSFSAQNPTSFISLYSWTDFDNLIYQATYNGFDAAGTAVNGVSPGTAWTNLVLDHWYRLETVVDFATNQLVGSAITDLTTGIRTSTTFTDFYMLGGAAGGTAPTAFRFFTGGNIAGGNVMAFDNISIAAIPEPASFLLLGIVGLGLVGFRRTRS